MLLLKKKQTFITNTVTKKELLQRLNGKDVVKDKLVNVAGRLFIQYEKELDESNQILKGYEYYIGDVKIKNDVLNKVFENIIKENVNSEKDVIYKNNSIKRFIKNLKNNRRELQSNKYFLRKKVSVIFYEFFLCASYKFLLFCS